MYEVYRNFEENFGSMPAQKICPEKMLIELFKKLG